MNRKTGKLILLICIGALFAGCTYVRTTTTPFFEPEFSMSGKIVVMAADASLNSSLEFKHYKRKFEEKLSQVGFEVTDSLDKADYIALVAYGIDEGKSKIVSTPIMGQTGGGTTYSSGTVYGYGGSASYSSSSYTMPTYGIVGAATSSVTQYTRAIALDIIIPPESPNDELVKVYEGRARSIGKCGAIAGVFDEILEAMFRKFPGVSGKPYRTDVVSQGGC